MEPKVEAEREGKKRKGNVGGKKKNTLAQSLDKGKVKFTVPIKGKQYIKMIK